MGPITKKGLKSILYYSYSKSAKINHLYVVNPKSAKLCLKYTVPTTRDLSTMIYIEATGRGAKYAICFLTSKKGKSMPKPGA